MTPTLAPILTSNPASPGPTVAACEDSNTAILSIVLNGQTSFQTCQFLADNRLQGQLCTPSDISGAYNECLRTCGRCRPELTASPNIAPVSITMPATVTPTLAPIPTPTNIPVQPTIPCEDSDQANLFIIVDGQSTFQSCQYLIDKPFLQTNLCRPDDFAGAYDACLRTCNGCPEPAVPSTAKPVLTVAPVPDPTKMPISPAPTLAPTLAPVIRAPTAKPTTPAPTAKPSPPPTSSPTQRTTEGCNDTDGTFFVVFDGVAKFENCQFLQSNPQLVLTECSAAAHLEARTVCPRTCDACP